MSPSGPSAVAAVFAILALVVGCSSTEEPSSNEETTASKPAEPTEPELPNIALKEDGETPILCADWPNLSEDIRHGMVFNALVKAGEAPATDAKVDKARKVVDKDCTSEPDSVAYVVALRAAMSTSG